MPASKRRRLEERNATRGPASAPLPEHRFGRDTVLAASLRGSVKPDRRRVPHGNRAGNEEAYTCSPGMSHQRNLLIQLFLGPGASPHTSFLDNADCFACCSVYSSRSLSQQYLHETGCVFEDRGYCLRLRAQLDLTSVKKTNSTSQAWSPRP
jgi:hypothetical protein